MLRERFQLQLGGVAMEYIMAQLHRIKVLGGAVLHKLPGSAMVVVGSYFCFI